MNFPQNMAFDLKDAEKRRRMRAKEDQIMKGTLIGWQENRQETEKAQKPKSRLRAGSDGLLGYSG